MAVKVYSYKGWHFAQLKRGYWGMVRNSDGFKTHHNSKGGCESFIRQHGTAEDPDLTYENSINIIVVP